MNGVLDRLKTIARAFIIELGILGHKSFFMTVDGYNITIEKVKDDVEKNDN